MKNKCSLMWSPYHAVDGSGDWLRQERRRVRRDGLLSKAEGAHEYKLTTEMVHLELQARRSNFRLTLDTL